MVKSLHRYATGGGEEWTRSLWQSHGSYIKVSHLYMYMYINLTL